MSGEIVFVRGRSLFGKLIKLFTGSKWTHVYVRIIQVPSTSKWLILEASGLKVKLILEPYYAPERRKSFIPRAPEMEINAALVTAIGKIGDSYSYLAVLGYVWVVFARKVFGISARNPFQKGVYCTRLISEIAGDMGSKKYYGPQDSSQKVDIEPDDLMAIMENDKETFDAS